jgi:hypothetical protein
VPRKRSFASVRAISDRSGFMGYYSGAPGVRPEGGHCRGLLWLSSRPFGQPPD